ncbi:MAG: C4-type zinc ribbon domain-containing protein [Chloroflexota bacterium]|nr:C4-type zinc ribbon domain-containing protein [Chloroflexota bacterium]
MSKTLNLYRLQKLDSQIDKNRERLDSIDQALNDNLRVRRAIKVLERARKNTKSIRIKLNQIEDKVEGKRIKRKLVQNALFNGKISNPKELRDLQMESEALKRYINQLEDEQLEAMIENETAETSEKKAEKALNKAKATTAEENASLLGEQLKLQDDLERLLREKEAVLGAIPPEDLSLYNRLRVQKRGTAIAEVSEGGCSICGQALTPADQQLIRLSNQLVFCPSCGRILYEK